jgi:hypothetical protein
MNDNRVGGHDIGDGRRQRLLAGQHTLHQVAFGENAEKLARFAHQYAAHALAAHQANGIGDGVSGLDLERRPGL